jgi:hypothetical protein
VTAAIDSLQALKAQLETITIANGYATDIGAVSIGRDALAVGSKATLPIITLTTLRDDPSGGTMEAGVWLQTWTRTVEMELLVAGADGWETALDIVWDDARRAMARYAKPLTLGGISFIPPSDGGEIASTVLQLTYSYTVDYSP